MMKTGIWSSALGAAAAMMMAAIAVPASAQTIQFWTTEEQPERLARQEEMASNFESELGNAVEVIPITESDLGTRASEAFATNDLPECNYHTLQCAGGNRKTAQSTGDVWLCCRNQG